MNIIRCTVLYLAFVGIGLLESLGTNAEAEGLRTVAVSSNVAPDSGDIFSSFGLPVLNDHGQTAFPGTLAGPGVDPSNDLGLWSEGTGTLGLVARESSAAPGTSANFSSLSDPVLNNAGQIAFLGGLAGLGVDPNNDRGIWSEGGGPIALVAREGDAAPDTTVIFSRIALPPVFNNSGQTAFHGQLSGIDVDHGNDRGIWSEGSGSLTLVVRDGNAAPGTGAIFSGSEFPVLNGLGKIAFRGILSGTGVISNNNSGIWYGSDGSLVLVVREGEVAPGTNASFSGFGLPVVNNASQTAFLGNLLGTEVDSNNDSGVWSGGSGSIILIAREGSVAPGVDGNFASFSDPVMNGAGQVLFRATLEGEQVSASNNHGIWSEGNGSLALLARSGHPASGTSATFSSFEDPIINAMGQAAFLGYLTGLGVGSNNNSGIWAQNSSGVLTLIVREGDLLDIDNGLGTDFRQISELGFVGGSGNEDGRASGFNDLGQVAFRARFTDGSSGIFVSDLVAIPEPSSSLLLCIAVVGLLFRCTKNRTFF
ncbi:DUF7453 family protein [Bythopirellula goksoeyrii]|uniref:PEP-CTERM protein-sorting domain-containing protein n=1 Tax=Bythopirellula goksoeyrii TaxID=1400387 RepID=A0A5B9QB27_9BACT|nr:choice-of-anchor tandem repeat NxxGxxAF-containing protein [Bythopirellula goksoeyrii]QEG36264.1 hypothetical protein Pr1d_35760 [Bythopirellula goksoeyrii]